MGPDTETRRNSPVMPREEVAAHAPRREASGQASPADTWTPDSSLQTVGETCLPCRPPGLWHPSHRPTPGLFQETAALRWGPRSQDADLACHRPLFNFILQ